MGTQADKEFFEREVMDLMDRMYAAAMRLCRNHADAEDLVSAAVLQGWQKLDQLEDRSKFGGWMMRIVSNKFISDLRRKRPEISFAEDAPGPTGGGGDETGLYARLHRPFLMWYGAPEKTYVNNLLREDIEKALDSLPETFRVVVVMVEVMGFQYAEVARQLEVPVGTVRSRLNRGRQLLQKALWQQGQDAGLVKGEPEDRS